MDVSEMREKTVDELKDELVRLKRELFNIRFQLVDGTFINMARVQILRREVARVKTVICEMKNR